MDTTIIQAWAEMCRVLYPKAYKQAVKLYSDPDDIQQLTAEYAYFYQHGELPKWRHLLADVREVGSGHEFIHWWQIPVAQRINGIRTQGAPIKAQPGAEG